MKIKDIYKANPGRNTNKYPDFIDYIDTSSVNQGRLEGVQYLLNGEYPSRAQRLIKSGDILYSSVRPNLRHYYMYKDNYQHPVASTGFVLLRQYNLAYDNMFCYYYLSTNTIVTHLSNIAELSQATFPSCSAKDIENINLPDINITQQRRIASILSIYDNLIENNNKRIRLLEQMAENLYKEWFVRFRFPGHEKAEFENGLPKGWKIWSISKLCDINRKTLNSKNKGLEIEYLDTSSITCNQIVGTESYVFEEAPSRARRIVKHNSIVFSTVRPNLKHYGILKNIPDNLIVSTGFAVFDSKYDIANIIYLFLSSQEVVDYCQLIAEGAVATYPSIKPEEIGRLKVALPNIEIAENWNGKLESFYSEILNIQKQNTLLSRQRDLLLPRLMSGKLEVKV